jgi:hypothetical protein
VHAKPEAQCKSWLQRARVFIVERSGHGTELLTVDAARAYLDHAQSQPLATVRKALSTL